VNWPARAAALIAAGLGLDPAAMQKVLEAPTSAPTSTNSPKGGSISDDMRASTALKRRWAAWRRAERVSKVPTDQLSPGRDTLSRLLTAA
jgi:hypothetical protein